MSERGEDETVRYVTLACACGGKARNRILNVANPHPTGRIFGSLVVGAGGFENLSFLETNCRNYIDKARHLRLGAGGAGALREYFFQMQYKNSEFFALMDLDDDGRLKNTNLKEFVNQYDNALKKKIENENCADFQSFNVTIPCISRSPIEKRYQDLYTNAKFREVQHQLTGIINLDPVLLGADATVKTYLVDDEVRVEDFTKLVTHLIDFIEDDAVAKCSCSLFEMRGIVCQHIFAVFKCNGIMTIPDRYILDQWRKDIKRGHTLIHSGNDAGNQREDANRYSNLLNICYKMITCAASSKKHTEDATTKLNAMIDLYEAN
ncbi:hypothetical protein F2P56_012844 [Juglans regia]|uniref:Protein FAR1-RELATED SEQUENCE n=2 Tax=Juglans regia TaxID=51240 RepID=A0A834CYJ3_JUGRE|nr:protein FAR1-RELATED SEQUENCE 9-like [Juglans regia]KAF5468708.1 hypothetical protein F2P56_012844 [Juglans regia]